MNLLILDPSELSSNGQVVLTGDRARHLRRILKVSIGDSVRVGILDGLVGTGVVTALEGFTVTLACRCVSPPPPAGQDVLLLALARPKVLLRCLEHATALGFGRIILFRSHRVEKSQLGSSAMNPEVMQRHIVHGLVQARRTLRPPIDLFNQFEQMLEAQSETPFGSENRFVADPDAVDEAALSAVVPAPITLAIGPEGGFISKEIDALVDCGFSSVRAGSQPLRVETAVSYLCGQLRAARSIRLNRS